MRVALVVLLAFGLAAFTYLRLERIGPSGLIPLALRGIAWTAIGLLLINVSCPAPAVPRRPLVLLDRSLSMTAAGGRGAEAHDSALGWGDVRTFGGGRSLIAPALVATSAGDQPVIVVTDGEVEDAEQVPPDILARVGVRLFARTPLADVAIMRVAGPMRVTAGDLVPLEIDVQTFGGPAAAAVESVTVAVAAGDATLATRRLRLKDGTGRTRVAVPSARLGAGQHVLRISLADHADAEPRTDTRLHIVTVTPTPGVVLVASPGDWDGRFLYRTLREVAQLPVRGYVRVAGNRWHTMDGLASVSAEQVRRAARGADVLILKGSVGQLGEAARARGVWLWPSGAGTGTGALEPIPGDWYLSAGNVSPIGDAFLGQPIDSFPPATQLIPMQSDAVVWIALSAQLGRRGSPRPAIVGHDAGRTRRVTVLVDGLWRWAFRGGASEQAYRTWVDATVSWLLAGADSVRGAARPIRPVVSNGRPIVFQWAGSGAPQPVAVSLTPRADRTAVTDTLRFDGAGRALIALPPGEYRYRLGDGGSGVVAVEHYSEELLPRAVTLTAREPTAVSPTPRTAARDWLWLFGLCILALSGEWFARRRLGLR